MTDYLSVICGIGVSALGYLLKQAVFKRIDEVEARAQGELQKIRSQYDQHISALEVRVNTRLDEKWDLVVTELRFVREQQSKFADHIGSIRESLAALTSTQKNV